MGLTVVYMYLDQLNEACAGFGCDMKRLEEKMCCIDKRGVGSASKTLHNHVDEHLYTEFFAGISGRSE